MTIEVLAPAKVNLGLEVIRKREDGFHDIATVFQTISVFDRLRIHPGHTNEVQIVDRITRIEENLAQQALDALKRSGQTSGPWRVEIEKRIPIAAGLGGASADAAAVLTALANRDGRDERSLAEIALSLGSDVPFLLRGGAALAHGRGEQLHPLPGLTGYWLVLVSPAIELERKTARLYAALERSDFSDGSRIARVADALRQGVLPPTADLANPFQRPLLDLLTLVRLVEDQMLRSGAPFAALTGAGPTHYTIVENLGCAISLCRQIASTTPTNTRVLIARPVGSGHLERRTKT